MAKKKTILVAPLHWGLGHATRCIPIIKELLNCNYNVLLASDGAALLLLQKEFPNLQSLELPSYNITYPKKGRHFKWTIFKKIPHIKRTISSEKKIIKQLVSEGKIDGIISDDRFGVQSKKVPSVIITHQLKVLSGSTTVLSSKLHQKTIKKFDECWVPDFKTNPNLSGKLGHLNSRKTKVKYIGPLSRMAIKNVPAKYDILALISGPEPQRTLLEKKLIEELVETSYNVLLVQGVVEEAKKTTHLKNITIINFLKTSDLEKALNESSMVISRSGYTTIMDLVALEKIAFFIPTPGQFEQEYLAKRYKKLGVAPYCNQQSFTAEKINEVKLYKGFKTFKNTIEVSNLFSLFESKGKL